MGRQALRVRRWVLRLSLAGSLLLGVALVNLFAPVLGSLSSHQMLAMLGLVLLPAATAWAVIADRREARAQAELRTSHPPTIYRGGGSQGGGTGSPAYRAP